ncbi:MAG: paraquat-inducible protein A [Pseudomonadota bacterium]
MVPQRRAGLLQVLIALVTAALIFGAVTLPFLSIERYWMRNDATLIETALAFKGPLRLLSLVILALILLLPTLRLGLTMYVLVPIVARFRRFPGSARAFRWAEALRPWSMAEIFIIGCTVALIKIVALAEVTFGPAFYMFAGAVVLLWVQDKALCRQSLWDALGDD